MSLYTAVSIYLIYKIECAEYLDVYMFECDHMVNPMIHRSATIIQWFNMHLKNKYVREFSLIYF